MKWKLIFRIQETATENLNFEYEEDTDVQRGCSTVLQGHMMYFGGYPNTRQFSIIDNCRIEKYYPEMPFHFYDGSCNSFMGQTKVLLCFSSFTIPKVNDCHL